MFYSSLITIAIFILSVSFIYNYILSNINSYDILGIFDGISMGMIYLVLFLFIISPFIFTKIIYNKFNLKSFFVFLALSIAILIIKL